MVLSEKQRSLIELTMKLDLKTREYDNICKKIDEYKESKNDLNSEEFSSLLNSLKKNNEEINEINNLIAKIK